MLDHLEIGHSGRTAQRTAPLLQREGFDLGVAALGAWGPVGDELEDLGIRTVAVGAGSAWNPRAIGRFLSLVRRDRVQVIHGLSRRVAVPVRVLGRLASVPVVVTSLQGGDLSQGWKDRWLHRLSAPMADAVVVSSETVRRMALGDLGLRPGNVRLIRAGVPEPARDEGPGGRASLRRELGAGPHDGLIGIIGSLREPERGGSVFLAAARILATEIPGIRFVLIGDGPDRRALEARAAVEGVSHRTLFAGRRHDLAMIVPALDLLVQPALRAAPSLAVLEAMALGVPVVATRTGEIPELIADGSTGVLVSPGDAPALAQACLGLLRDRDRALRIAMAARRQASESHRLEAMVESLASLYRELLEPPGGSTEPSSGAGGATA